MADKTQYNVELTYNGVPFWRKSFDEDQKARDEWSEALLNDPSIYKGLWQKYAAYPAGELNGVEVVHTLTDEQRKALEARKSTEEPSEPPTEYLESLPDNMLSGKINLNSGIDSYQGINNNKKFSRLFYSAPTGSELWGNLRLNGLNQMSNGKGSFYDTQTYQNFRSGQDIAAISLGGTWLAPYIAAALPEMALATPQYATTAGRFIWNKALPFLAKYGAAPTAAGMAVDEAQRAVTGTTATETVSNFLRNRGWNSTLADLAGGSVNPGYWVNFGGVGRYTAPLFNKIGIGTAEKEILSTPQVVLNNLPKSKFQTKVVQPTLDYIDKNLYKIQAVTNPWLPLTSRPTSITQENMPRFRFVTDPSELHNDPLTHFFGQPNEIEYVLFKNAKNNEKVFGDALRLQTPRVNTKAYLQDYNGNTGSALSHLASTVTAGAAATDLAVANPDNRPDWLKTLEYLTLARYGANRLVKSRLFNLTSATDDYLKRVNNITNRLNNFFGHDPIRRDPEGYTFFWDWNAGFNSPQTTRYMPKNLPSSEKPAFNYKKASFDDLAKYISKNNLASRGLNVDSNVIIDNQGRILARKGVNGETVLENETFLKQGLSRDINLVDYRTGQTYTGKIQVGDNGEVSIPQEYTDILNSNIDYVQNVLFPGSGVKLFGSSAGVTQAGFPHATHDIDFYITKKQMDAIRAKNPSAFQVRTSTGPNDDDVSTWLYKIENGKYGEAGDIDLNVIGETPEGLATGIRAEELYQQYFPDEYFKALREFKSGEVPGTSIRINKTPEELLEAMDPSSKTIMDSFDIDFTRPEKGKHSLRSWTHLVYSDPQEVAKGIQQYAKSMLGSRVQLFPMQASQLTDKELNRQALQKLGVTLNEAELEKIASDPQRMKNVLDAWYMMDNTAMRAVNDTWADKGWDVHTADNFVRSAIEWDPINNNGNANGAGLNLTIKGDSQHSGALKAYVSPNTEYKSTNLLDLIDEINYNFGGHPDAPAILSKIPRVGHDAKDQLQKVFDTYGWNFLQNGMSYGQGQYVSATRTFDPSKDYIGFSSFRKIMHPLVPRVNNANNPILTDTYRGQAFGPRTISAPFDYHLGKVSFMEPQFAYNKYRGVVNTPFRDTRPYSFLPDKIDNATIAVPLTGAGMIQGFSAESAARKQNWIQNAITQPDVIIQNMSEEDRAKFTPQGIEKMKEKYKNLPYLKGASDQEIMDYIYWNLENTYSKYRSGTL